MGFLKQQERFLDVTLTRDNNIIAGKIYQFLVFENDVNVIIEVCNREGDTISLLESLTPIMRDFRSYFSVKRKLPYQCTQSNIEASCAAHPTADVLINFVVIGPATVGGIQAGAFKIGDTAGTIDNIIHCKLYRPRSIGFVSKYVGNKQVDHILSFPTDLFNPISSDSVPP
ncbi:ATP-citrate synthase beta chain protein 1 [Pyrus ussuriensis x Pyrus communis]|uniref:ATP-citrate synthase beta chain protein 1 n=1 Tax=Pyrus ussuriensis x Pyrus communis TaxID=2448454 RepID=A0A5N5H7V8_9ROSA|nr:ATP-citrate synthase beta chain protein 1 [Pyrus ussuriensis x Pyrus communis]